MLWTHLARGDRGRGARIGLAGAAARPAGRPARPHRGHRLDRDDRCPRRRPASSARAVTCSPPSTRTSPSRRPRGSSGSSAARPCGRRVPDAQSTRSPSRSTAPLPSLPTARHHVDDLGRSGARDRRRSARTRAPGSTSTRPTRARPRCATSSAGRSTAPSSPTPSSINPHKWLFTPMDCSCFWTRRPDAVFRGLQRRAPSTCRSARERSTDLKDYGPALGRRFRGLKLWAVLRCYGREGLQALIREHVRLAQLFASWVEEEPGWEVAAPHALLVVCFRREGSDEENAAHPRAREPKRRGIPQPDASRRPLSSSGSRSATRGRPRTTCARAWAALQEAAA